MPHSIERAREDINTAIDQFISRGETFTAAHVTMAVRAQALWAGTYSHNAVAPEVRSAFSHGRMPGYEQTLRNDMSGGVYAYHPIGEDPSTVDLRIGGPNWLPRVDLSNFRNGAPPVTDARPLDQRPPRTGSSTRAPATPGTDTVSVPYNGQGYAQLPRTLTRLIDLEPGDDVVLEGVQLGNEVTLRKARTGETPVARLQMASGALRIRDRALMPYGVGNGDDVEVTVNASEKTLTLR